MAKIALISLTGETNSWVIDFGAGTVTSTSEAYYAKARASGITVLKGVDVAVVENATASPVSFQYST